MSGGITGRIFTVNNSNAKPYFTYDIETYINCFLFAGKFLGDDRVYVFEVSEFKNQKDQLIAFLNWLASITCQNPVCKTINGVVMTGFNSLGFDYNIIHEIITNPHQFTYRKAYDHAQFIIGSQKFGNRAPEIWQSDRIIAQLDLFKLHHFDNRARTTNLKNIEFAMRSQNVADLPYDPHTPLTPEQILHLIEYNIHDVRECEKFLIRSMPQVNLRLEFLDEKILRGDVLNYNDTKMGKKYLEEQLGKVVTHEGKNKRQTFRAQVRFCDIILPDFKFEDSVCRDVLDWYKGVVVYPGAKKDKSKDKDKIKKVIQFAGLKFHFGLGGAHASVDEKKFVTNGEFEIIDIDVTSFYPSAAINNQWRPAHLGQHFVDHYKSLRTRRVQYAKGTPMNAMLKLALNGVFGDGNNVHSIYYDPQFLYSITINCQMYIFWLAQMLSDIPDLQLIQVNTDGITAYVPVKYKHWFEMIKIAWMNQTKLELEEVQYSKMWIRDVNNYLAIDMKGKVKRKGAYWFPEKDSDYEGNWHKDFSKMVVPKAAEKVMTEGYSPEFAVAMFGNPFDFMMRYKTTGDSRVYIGDRKMLKTVRFYVSTKGEPMSKNSPATGEEGQWKRKTGLSDSYYESILSSLQPFSLYNSTKFYHKDGRFWKRSSSEMGSDTVVNTLPRTVWDERIHTGNKSTYEERDQGLIKGYLVRECNDARNFNASDLNYQYYVDEVKKLIIA